jgi:putative aldouronate transport system substrate-binding protein
MADAPKGPDGKFGYFNWGPLTGGQYFFGRELGDDRLPAVLEMLETMFTDVELATTLKHGVEGEHWERDPETNAIVPLPPYDDPEQRGPLGTNIYFEPVPEVWETWQRSDLAELTAKATAGNLDFVPYAELNVPAEVYEGLDLRTIQSTWYLDLISGRESLDRWEDFVSEYNSQGGEDLTSATQESIQSIDAAKEEIIAALE